MLPPAREGRGLHLPRSPQRLWQDLVQCPFLVLRGKAVRNHEDLGGSWGSGHGKPERADFPKRPWLASFSSLRPKCWREQLREGRLGWDHGFGGRAPGRPARCPGPEWGTTPRQREQQELGAHGSQEAEVQAPETEHRPKAMPPVATASTHTPPAHSHPQTVVFQDY